LLTSSQNHFRPRLLSTSERNCWDGNVSHLPFFNVAPFRIFSKSGGVWVYEMLTCLYDSGDASHLPCVFQPHFSELTLSEHLDFSKCIPPIELSYDRLSPFSLFVHHTIILNIITRTWLHLFCLYVTTMMNRSPLYYITCLILFITRVSPNSNSPTSCHCSTCTTCHRPSYILHFIDTLLVTIYSIYTKHHLYRIPSTVYSNSI
jgi:hypothetical protein